jgi:hypothetical protein
MPPTMYRMIALPDIIVERLPDEAELRTCARVKDPAVLYRKQGQKKISVRKLSEFLRLFEPVG